MSDFRRSDGGSEQIHIAEFGQFERPRDLFDCVHDVAGLSKRIPLPYESGRVPHKLSEDTTTGHLASHG